MFLREALPRSFSLLICFAMRDFPEFKHMDSCARALVSRRRLQMGYPFNQGTDFADYYAFLMFFDSRISKQNFETYIKEFFEIVKSEIIPIKKIKSIVDEPLIMRYFLCIKHLPPTVS